MIPRILNCFGNVWLVAVGTGVCLEIVRVFAQGDWIDIIAALNPFDTAKALILALLLLPGLFLKSLASRLRWRRSFAGRSDEPEKAALLDRIKRI